jgi:hypothetical protein
MVYEYTMQMDGHNDVGNCRCYYNCHEWLVLSSAFACDRCSIFLVSSLAYQSSLTSPNLHNTKIILALRWYFEKQSAQQGRLTRRSRVGHAWLHPWLMKIGAVPTMSLPMPPHFPFHLVGQLTLVERFDDLRVSTSISHRFVNGCKT